MVAEKKWLVTWCEIADYLQISESTARRWGREGQLPVKRIGRQVRISIKVIEDLMI